MERQRPYRVTKTIHLSRDVEATSAAEAERIAKDMGESGADSYSSEWRAKALKRK